MSESVFEYVCEFESLKRGSEFSAGYDLLSSEDTIIEKNKRSLVKTGIRINNMPTNCYIRIAPRSGLACKGIDISAGVVDSDYRGEIKVLIVNNSNDDFIIKRSDRIAQIIFEQVIHPEIIKIKDIVSKTDRGEGGFGSTGIN